VIYEKRHFLIDFSLPSVFDCFLREDGNYPDVQERCSSVFYSCVGGSLIKRLCPLSTRYDQRSDSCQFAEHVLECGGKPPVTTTTTTLSTEAPRKCSTGSIEVHGGTHSSGKTGFYVENAIFMSSKPVLGE